MDTALSRPPAAPSQRRTLTVLMLARLVLNIQVRIAYPFLPAISRGLGVPLEMAGLLITARSAVGMTSPLYGYLSDRYGRRALMLAGLGALVAGAALVGVAPTFGVALFAFVLMGFAKSAYDPALQAFIGDTVPYEQRGRVIGLQELAWAGAWLIGAPGAGYLIAGWGWRSPFLVVALLSVIGLIAVWRTCPPRSRDGSRAGAAAAGMFDARWLTLPAAMALAFGGLLMLANENFFIVYGAWLEGRFGLSVATLGLASTVIAGAELLAETASAGLLDHIGKRRAVLATAVLHVLSYLALPLVAVTLGGALAGVFIMMLTFEFCVVSMLSLISELAPEARGTVMALNVAAMGAGRVLGSLAGPRLWEMGGMTANAVVSAALVAVAAMLLWRGVREREVPGP